MELISKEQVKADSAISSVSVASNFCALIYLPGETETIGKLVQTRNDISEVVKLHMERPQTSTP